MRWIPVAIFSFVLLGGGGLHAGQIEREKVDVLLYRDFRKGAPLFARAGFVTAIADAPSDESGGMDDHFRSSKAHHADIKAAVEKAPPRSSNPPVPPCQGGFSSTSSSGGIAFTPLTRGDRGVAFPVERGVPSTP